MRISDWSSDVCSSDLPKPQPAKRGLPAWLKTMPLTAWAADFEEEVKTVKGCPPVIDAMTHGFLLPLACDLHVDRGRFRSEDRRVGKEGFRMCRSGWAPVHTQTNKE